MLRRFEFPLSAIALVALIAWSGNQFLQERFNAVAFLATAFCCYYLGARYYSGFLARRVLELDDQRETPAHFLRDDRDYMPFRRWTLFGMHFAWIAGPGPLIGPTLAMQFGYLPGFVWVVAGAVLFGCVQDFVILAFSTRRNGMSLARMIRNEVHPIAGMFALIAVLFILVILLGVLALFVVNALKGSAWGTFTIAASIPIAFFVGWYMTHFRPGREGQATAIGVALLIVATAVGSWVAENPLLSSLFNRTDAELALAVVVYGFFAAALPAWMLLAPRDNISTYLKVGTVLLLAIGILFAQPSVEMPPLSRFTDGSGPIFGGGVFPFCFIIIACGAISGFHSLIASGTTPRFLDKESDMRVVAYGAMLTESFVGVMALIAAATLSPGVYLAMNIPPRASETAVQLTERISAYGPRYEVTTEEMAGLAAAVHEESLYNRSGGGPSLAIGMARIFSDFLGAKWLGFWYHFAIMFEAVFILTVLDSGTRVIRFVFQELLNDLAVWKRRRRMAARRQGGEAKGRGGKAPEAPLWLTSLLAVCGWGAILSWGIIDREGGTRALVKIFGTANQLLAVIALTLATFVLFKTKRRYVWVTGVPLICVGAITITAALEQIFSSDPRVGAIAAARAASGTVGAHNAWLVVSLVGILLAFVAIIVGISAREAVRIFREAGVKQ